MTQQKLVIHLFLKPENSPSIAQSNKFPDVEDLADFIPSENSFNVVIKKLGKLGIKAYQSGSTALRLEASKSIFEDVFSCRIKIAEDGTSYFSTPAIIPETLSQWVDAIDIPPGLQLH
ncbi:hypothetical protein [Aliikangiella maris]|uniref:Uncharacterized protein n=2 Tax=Aliikangiella maris TaxID=3162458 RepID=A0ABV2BUZ1_9GAMM